MHYPESKQAGDTLFEQSVRKMVEAAFVAEPMCRFGKPAAEIMKAASPERAELIVMGARAWCRRAVSHWEHFDASDAARALHRLAEAPQ